MDPTTLSPMYQETNVPSTNKGLFWQTRASPEKIAYLKKHALPNTVLDVGCGAGWYTRFLTEQGFHVIPVDLVTRMPDSHAFGFTHARAEALPFRDKAFDTVIMFDVLEHIPDEMAVLSEAARVTRKRLILSVPSDDDAFLYSYGLCLLHHIDKTHMREYSPESLRQRLESVGFAVVDVYLSKARQMPLVVLEFFRPRRLYQLFKWATARWINALMHRGIIANEVAGDIFCVADRR